MDYPGYTTWAFARTTLPAADRKPIDAIEAAVRNETKKHSALSAPVADATLKSMRSTTKRLLGEARDRREVGYATRLGWWRNVDGDATLYI